MYVLLYHFAAKPEPRHAQDGRATDGTFAKGATGETGHARAHPQVFRSDDPCPRALDASDPTSGSWPSDLWQKVAEEPGSFDPLKLVQNSASLWEARPHPLQKEEPPVVNLTEQS